ncbi:hypothetical protein PYW08_012802 [Mythimna loreyi]|uniref:Uncharacterized protein n=1 Tax=Mythimna loreyi TaxID=667449 RepID=A0ACC2Q329_9NEOP|nr:hypothetical protein PYW08_012802 [Mythimna loreyi]
MNSTSYKKRPGTSGIQGQLYETKLISLIYFRMLHDNNIKQFNLATNRDEVGAFDDMCFKANVKSFNKPLAVFIQAKHRENDKLLTFTSKSDLIKYFDSYLLVRRGFETNSKDMIFGKKFDETECVFVMYTTAKNDPNNKVYKGPIAEYLNKLIGTGGSCTQPSYTDEDLDFLCKIVVKEHMTILAEQLAKFISKESDSEMSMNNDLMTCYHVILALNVFDVSEIQPEGHRIATFKKDFFTSNDEYITPFKHKLCLGVLKKQELEDIDIQSLILTFLSDPSDVNTLSKLLTGSVLKYKKDKLEFVSKSVTDDQKRQLDKANVLQSTVYEAAELATKDYLLSLKLKVPAFFGNKDLAIRGNEKRIQKRLEHLTTKIKEIIIKQSNPNHIVNIDESWDDGLLQLNGGIASAVGNILVFDETSKLLKFTDTCESLGKLAKTWYETLTSEIPNLQEYRLDVKVEKFPKLSFKREQSDEDLVRDFYNKLVFFTNQADQSRVEEILRKEIEDHPCNDVNSFKDRSGLIFLEYHDQIQKLWMTPKEGSYLTKKNKIYENAVTYAMSQSLISVIRNMHKFKNQDFTFNDDAIKRFESQGQILGTVIVSESYVLTVAKVEQYLRNKDYVVIDLESIFKLPFKTHDTLCKELTNITKDNIFVIVFNTLHSSGSRDRLETIAKAIIDAKQVIVITNKISVEIITKYFPQANKVRDDERSVFKDLSADSQKKFLATSIIKLQGVDVSLDVIVGEKSALLIDEDAFYKIMNNEIIEIGKAAIYSNYEEQLYIDRRVSRTKTREHDKFDEVKDKIIKTLYDLEEDIVLITAEKGMGKSTLLTQLSLKTKQLEPKAWIVRINLPDYERLFKTFEISINSLKSLEFQCQAALEDTSIEFIGDDFIEENKNKVLLLKNSSGIHSKMFQFNLFLYYYYSDKLILVIDGFDEMKPECQIVFGSWLKKERHIRKPKIWITSSPSSLLEEWCGPSYKLQNFSHLDHEAYLIQLWRFKIPIKNVSTKDMQDIEDFVHYMHNTRSKSEYLTVYLVFLKFLKMDSLVVGSEFSYEEYYDRFVTRFGISENAIPCIPDHITPEDLYELAKNFDADSEGLDRMFCDISQGIYADF